MFVAGGVPSAEAARDAAGRKQCPRCLVHTANDGYHRSNRRAGWLASDGTYRQSYCKQCQSKERIAQGRRRVAQLEAIKVEQGCADCGFRQHPAALDFHHVGVKTLNISTAACSGVSLQKLLEELALCIVLCANCHRVRHAKQRQSART